MDQLPANSTIVTLLSNYDLGDFVSLEELAPGFANRSFKLETESGYFLLRWVLEKNHADLKLELQLLNYLRGYQFPTSYPVEKRDGTFTTQNDPGNFVIYDFISGSHPVLSTDTAAEIGGAVGELSNIKAPPGFHRRNMINIENCLSLANQLDKAPVQLPDIYQYFRETSKWIWQRRPPALPRGLIHADVFPDNTLFNGEHLNAIIDFEEVCVDDLLFDLAMTINGFCFPDNSISWELLSSLISAYAQQRYLVDEEWQALPIYIAWTAHGMLSWHLERLSQSYLERQEHRVRQLMSRVIDLLENETQVAQQLLNIRKLIKK